MIIWTLIGIFIQWVGKLFKRADVLFIGYYLAGSGKTRSLPVYVHEAVLNELGWLRQYCHPDTYIVHRFDNLVLFHTIGKCWVKKDGDLIYIKDRYMFYPLCPDSDTHFSDCGCKPEWKVYSSLTKHMYITPQRYTDKLLNSRFRYLHFHRTMGRFISVTADIWGIKYEINDEFWVNKGKPFDVYSEIPIYHI